MSEIKGSTQPNGLTGNVVENVLIETPPEVASNSTKTLATQMQRRFPGTISYQDNKVSRALFFGRDDEAQRLLHLILAETLVVLFAKSGNGKTSLLHAKIFKKLRDRNFLPIVARLNHKDYSPEEVIKNELLALNALPNFELITDTANLQDGLITYFQKTEIWSSDDKLFTPVIILDQFEEIFTLEHNAKYRDDFFSLLGGMLKARREGLLNIKIIIAIREDFLGYLKRLTNIIPTTYSNMFRLEGLNKDYITEVIEKPAGIEIDGTRFVSEKFSFSPGAIEQLQRFLSPKNGKWNATEEIEPIQLQIICSELEERVIKNEIISIDGKIEIQESDLGGEKGLQEILGYYYDKQLGKLRAELVLNSNEITAIRNVIEKELIAGEKRVPLAYEALANRKDIRKDGIDLLIANRLLRVEERGTNSLVEICHDTLVEPILNAYRERRGDEVAMKRNKMILMIASLAIVSVAAILVFFL